MFETKLKVSTRTKLEGGLCPRGLYSDVFFCLQVDEPIIGRAYKRGEGGCGGGATYKPICSLRYSDCA